MKCPGAVLAVLLLTLRPARSQELHPDPAELEAGRAFETHVAALYARQLRKAEAQGLWDAAGTDPPATAGASGDQPSVEAPALSIQHVFDNMAISFGPSIGKDFWQVGIRLRYARSVEFDPSTSTYALVEAFEIVPAVGVTIASWARHRKVIVRRAGFNTWDEALFKAPSRWVFNRPNKIEEARALTPGTEVTMSSEGRFFFGLEGGRDVGAWFAGARVGGFLSGEYFVRIQRLAKERSASAEGKEWVLSAGGILEHGFETSLRVRSPEIALGRRLPLFDGDFRKPAGFRFLQRVGPQDLGSDPQTEKLFQTIVSGAGFLQFSDLKLLGGKVKKAFAKPELGVDVLDELRNVSRFNRVLDATEDETPSIPYSEAAGRFHPRGHGEGHLSAWAFLYGFQFSQARYGDDSLVRWRTGDTRRVRDYAFRSRWDRGWLFFPRESRELRILTLQDIESGDLFTEVSYQIEDSLAHRSEGRKYRRQILDLITPEIAAHFPMQMTDQNPPAPRTLRDQLPDLLRAPTANQRVSIYVQLILGPRFHDAIQGAAAEPAVRKLHQTIIKAIRGNAAELERLVSSLGSDQLFVNYRIALTPFSERKVKPRPTTVFVGSIGDPGRIPGYRAIRDTYDVVAASF